MGWLHGFSGQIRGHSKIFLLLIHCKNIKINNMRVKNIDRLLLSWFNCLTKGLNHVQVNLFQKYLFLYQLTHNMTKYCSLNYKFNTWKFQAQTWGEHVVYRNCFWHSEQYLYTTCSPHVLKKEEPLTKIYLYTIIINNMPSKM